MSIPARLRLAVYAVVLAVLGSWACFTHLDREMLVGDESCFAYTTDRMLRTGDYVVPHIHELSPHLNAAPLLNWLCCLTSNAIGEGNVRHRIWSAAFGVGCGLATLALGALLFGPEAGFLAGLLLLTNPTFLFQHAARQCVMEPMLAFFLTCMVICYVRTWSSGRPGLWWVLAGVCLGLAVMTKPPAVGGLLFAVLTLHHLFTTRELGWKARLAGPLRAGVAAALVALPWYAAVTVRLGPSALDELFLTNSVRRAMDPGAGSTRPATFYVNAIREASHGFGFALPALAWALGCVAVGWHRRAWSLVAALPTVFLLAISAAATKHPHYVYPVYPLLAVATAGMLLAGLAPPTRPATRAGRVGWGIMALVGAVLAVHAVRSDFRTVADTLDAERFGYPAQRIYYTAEPAIASGTARLVLYTFPSPAEQLNRKVRLGPHDRYYPTILPHALRVGDVSELNRLLADGKPTVVLLPPLLTAGQLQEGLQPAPDSVRMLRSDLLPYPVLAFHGAESRLGLGELFRVIEVPR